MKKRTIALILVIFTAVFTGGASIYKYFDTPPNKRISVADAIVDNSAGAVAVQGNQVAASLGNQGASAQGTQAANASLRSKYALENATFLDKNGLHVVKDPDDPLVLVNKNRNLSPDWAPKDLVAPKVAFAFSEDSPRRYMRKVAAAALEELFGQAKKQNINLVAISGYRSYDTQKRIFGDNVKIYGERAANQTSAKPGQSEHQTGLAMDITSKSADFKLEQSFENTPEGKWLKDNAAKAGFIIRYPKGKESITKYSYEPWHVRYVGKELASDIASSGLTLEEYFNALE